MAKRNPDPVVVGMVFSKSNNIFVIRRNIAPCKGGLALPGGYLERGEDWRKGLQREIREEARILVSTDPMHMKIYDARSTPDGQKLLIFAIVKSEGIKKIYDFKKNKEVSERLESSLSYYSSPQLCFPLHNEVIEQYRNETFTFENTHVGGW